MCDVRSGRCDGKMRGISLSLSLSLLSLSVSLMVSIDTSDWSMAGSMGSQPDEGRGIRIRNNTMPILDDDELMNDDG